MFVFETGLVATEDHLSGGSEMKILTEYKTKMAEILMHFILQPRRSSDWQAAVLKQQTFHEYLSSCNSWENEPLVSWVNMPSTGFHMEVKYTYSSFNQKPSSD